MQSKTSCFNLTLLRKNVIRFSPLWIVYSAAWFVAMPLLLGMQLSSDWPPELNDVIQILGAFIGCLLLYVGVAMFITMDMGVDPFTGVVLVLRDRLHMEYRKIKVIFDLCMMVLGFVLGGKLGVITILTAITAGPCIQAFSGLLKKFFESRGIDYE